MLVVVVTSGNIYHSVYDARPIDASTVWTATGPVTQLPLIGASGSSSCPAGTYSAAGGTACVTACPTGTYVSAGTTCSVCGIDTFSLIAATVCTPCPTGSVSPSASSAVRCFLLDSRLVSLLDSSLVSLLDSPLARPQASRLGSLLDSPVARPQASRLGSRVREYVS